MTKPTLDDFYARHGTQHAAYLDDYLKERGAHLIACPGCGRQSVVSRKPTREEARVWRCGECEPRAATALEQKGATR